MAKAPEKANKPAATLLIHQLVMIDITGKEVVRKVITPSTAYTLDVTAKRCHPALSEAGWLGHRRLKITSALR